MQPKTILTPVSRFLVTLAVPITLTVIMVRLVMSPLFLQIEYNRPGFPGDPFGFTLDQRLEYAPPAVTYLLNFEDISYLEKLRIPRSDVPINVCVVVPENENLCYQFNDRELNHMEDVKNVTQGTFIVGVLISLFGLLSGIYLWRTTPQHLRVALTGGSMLTVGLIGVIVLMALTAWDIFFTGFHQIFFEGDTWLFRYSDTLIRLFPEQFWFDAAIVIGSGVLLGAILIFMGTWYWARRHTASKRKAV